MALSESARNQYALSHRNTVFDRPPHHACMRPARPFVSEPQDGRLAEPGSSDEASSASDLEAVIQLDVWVSALADGRVHDKRTEAHLVGVCVLSLSKGRSLELRPCCGCSGNPLLHSRCRLEHDGCASACFEVRVR